MGEKKELKSPSELVEILKGKGITFSQSVDERAAINYLKKNNNYYKLTAYRKNCLLYTSPSPRDS